MPAASAPSARAATRPRLHRLRLRHLVLHDDDHDRPGLRPRRLGALLLGDGPGAWLDRGRPVRRRRRDRPPRHPAPGRRRRPRGRAAAEGKSLPDWLGRRAAADGRRRLRRRARWRAVCMSCPSSSATAPPSPTRSARAVIAGLGMERDIDEPRVALRRRPLRPRLRPAPDRRGPGRAAAPRSRRSRSAAAPAVTPLIRQLLADATGLPVLATGRRRAGPARLGDPRRRRRRRLSGHPDRDGRDVVGRKHVHSRRRRHTPHPRRAVQGLPPPPGHLPPGAGQLTRGPGKAPASSALRLSDGRWS